MPRTGSTLDDVRRRNLSAVLERVHVSGGVSRADLTAATGLNRSTIAALVADLAERRLVVEGEPDATNRVGRPSPRVAPHPDAVVIAVNPEIDGIDLAVVGLGATVLHRVHRPLDAVPASEEAVAVIAELVADAIAALPGGVWPRGIGLAVPGLVRAGDGLVRWAPHLGWTDVPIATLVADATGLPARAGNDAHLGATAEHRFGAGRGVDHLVYLNGGASGIGGGLVVDGTPLTGSAGYAGEFGHNRPGLASADDRRTPGGELEEEVNRARLLAVLGVAAADELELLALAATTVDPAAIAELARQRRILATALANAVNVLGPEIVVLGGFLAALLETDAAGLAALVAEQAIPVAAEGVRIVAAELGRDRLMIGAAELAFAATISDPAA